MFPDLGGSGSGMLTPALAASSSNALPTPTDVATFGGVVANELVAAQHDVELAVALSRGACKPLQLRCRRTLRIDRAL